MPSNDDVVWGLPHIQCPSCQFVLETSGQKFHKYSKAQRKARYPDHYPQATTSGYSSHAPHVEDQPSQMEENNFVVVTCPNDRCEQYSKLKALRVPRLNAPSIKLDL